MKVKFIKCVGPHSKLWPEPPPIGNFAGLFLYDPMADEMMIMWPAPTVEGWTEFERVGKMLGDNLKRTMPPAQSGQDPGQR